MSLLTDVHSTQAHAPRPATSFSVNACAVIDVADVERATTALPEVPFNLAVDTLLNPSTPPTNERPISAIEANSDFGGRLVAGVGFHPCVAAIHGAFNDHRPLVLSPDVIWMLVAQGFAHHVNANAEELRPLLVRHQGKLKIHVRRDAFVKGWPWNRWPEVFDEFAVKIREHIGQATYDLVVPTFSTTGAVERAAAQVVLLDAMQSYFEFGFSTLCGIPRIMLTGTATDWQRVAERAADLGRFGLQWWTEALSPILRAIRRCVSWTCGPSVLALHLQDQPRQWRSVHQWLDHRFLSLLQRPGDRRHYRTEPLDCCQGCEIADAAESAGQEHSIRRPHYRPLPERRVADAIPLAVWGSDCLRHGILGRLCRHPPGCGDLGVAS